MAASTFTKARPHVGAFPLKATGAPRDDDLDFESLHAIRRLREMQFEYTLTRRDKAALETVEVEDRRLQLTQRVVLFFERLVRAYRKGESDV